MEPDGSLQHSQVPILNQLDPIHTPNPSSRKIHLNITFPSKPGSPKWSLSLRYPHEIPVCASLLPVRATYPANPIPLDFIIRTILGEEYRSLSYSLCSFLHSSVTLSLLGLNILLNILFSDTLSPRSSLIVNDQISHPYKQPTELYQIRFSVVHSEFETRYVT